MKKNTLYVARTFVLATVQREHDFGILGSPFSSRYLFKSSMISLPSGEQSLRGTLEPALKFLLEHLSNVDHFDTEQ